MVGFLRRHPGDGGCPGRAITHDGQLAGVNPAGADLAGMIDAEHRRRIGRAQRRLGFSVSHRITSPNPSERIAFHPAIEMPNSDHCGWSQRTNGVANMSSRTFAGSPPMADEL